MNNLKKKLINDLSKRKIKNYNIVLMPHFCIDNFVNYGFALKDFEKELRNIVKRGGGNIVISQIQKRGGKAANVASGLSSLGLKPSLLAKTSPEGLELLKKYFKNRKIDLSHVSVDGPLAFTTVIELDESNIMINDPGALVDFGPDFLTKGNKDFIKKADLVYISDWGLNKKGTNLTEFVFGQAKEAKRFFDPGDSSSKEREELAEIEDILSKVIKKGLVDIISLSEVELEKYGQSDNFSKAVDNLRNYSRLCIHSADYAKSISGNSETIKIPTFKVKPLCLTGAGDSWNAGYIFGDLLDLTEEQKLLLGNAVAGFYISDKNSLHPSIEDLIKFIKNTPLKK